MDFFAYLQASGAVSKESWGSILTQEHARQFSMLRGRDASVGQMLEKYSDRFGMFTSVQLCSLGQHYYCWKRWQAYLSSVKQQRVAAKRPPFPLPFLTTVYREDLFEAAQRVDRLTPRESFETVDEWISALKAGVAIWDRCILLAEKQAVLTCELAGSLSGAETSYDSFINTNHDLAELAPHRWLAIRRGQQEGVLKLSILPPDSLASQVQVGRSELGASIAERTDESLLEELVLDNLEHWLFVRMDQHAETFAIDSACKSFVELLQGGHCDADRIGACYFMVQDKACGAVVVEQGNVVTEQQFIKHTDKHVSKLVDFFKAQNISDVVLPISIADSELKALVEDKFREASFRLHYVRIAGIREARQAFEKRGLKTPQASAAVLAERLMSPSIAWGRIDPLLIGLAEYQVNLDESRLRIAMKDALDAYRIDGPKNDKQPIRKTPSVTPPKQSATLNPLVKSINDLRPGMTVKGIVSNIANFGAFVNIGLSQDGLIHLSELADQFVSDAHTVVSVGEELTATVIEVNPARKRIGLSLRTASNRPENRPNQNSSNPGKSGAPKVGKRQALDDLEKFFKK